MFLLILSPFPTDFNFKFVSNVHCRHMRASVSNKIAAPRIKYCAHKTCFLHTGPEQWNLLPDVLTSIHIFNNFITAAYTHFNMI